MQLTGKHEDEQHVRLYEFIVQLNALRQALVNTDRIVNRQEKPTLYYRIVDLSHSSPASVVLEPAPYRNRPDISSDIGDEVIAAFFFRFETNFGDRPNCGDIR